MAKVYFPWFVKDIIGDSPTPASHLLQCVADGKLDITTARRALYQLHGDAVTLEQEAEAEQKANGTITKFIVW